MEGNWSSRHLVSCNARTSTSCRWRKAATRSARLRIEFTFQVAMRIEPSLRSGSVRLTSPDPLHSASGLAGRLRVALGDAGAQTLAALDELGRLRVEAGEELGEFVPRLLTCGAEVGALEDLPGAQDRADDLVVVQAQVIDAGLGDDDRVLPEVGHVGAGHLEVDDLV